MKLFETRKDWWTYTYKSTSGLVVSVFRLLWSVINGLLSLLVWLWRLLVRFVGRNPDIALGAFIVIAVVVWLLTFVGMRARAVGAEHQRDSISYELSKFTQMYDSTEYHESVIIDGDTIRY